MKTRNCDVKYKIDASMTAIGGVKTAMIAMTIAAKRLMTERVFRIFASLKGLDIRLL